jgi:hypothetical protein
MDTIEKVKEIITADPKLAPAWDVISATIEQERIVGIKAKTEANNEAKNLRERLHALEGIVKAEIGEVPDIAQAIKELKVKATSSKDKDADKSALLTELENYQKQANETRKKLDELQGTLESERQQKRRASLTTELTKALADKIYSPDLAIEGLLARGVAGIDADGKMYIELKDAKHALDEKGITALLESGLVDRKVTQRSGAGGSPAGGQNGALSDADKLARLKTLAGQKPY